jgi:hypothetical protein
MSEKPERADAKAVREFHEKLALKLADHDFFLRHWGESLGEGHTYAVYRFLGDSNPAHLVGFVSGFEVGIRYDFSERREAIPWCDELRGICEREKIPYTEAASKATIFSMREYAKQLTSIADRVEAARGRR